MTRTAYKRPPNPARVRLGQLNHPNATAWMDDAACAGMDPDLFFPVRGASTTEAKATCAACPVRKQCLEYALAAGQTYGIWGGLSERQRRSLRGWAPTGGNGSKRGTAA